MEGLKKLDKLWNHGDPSHTFIRGAERLGRAFRILKNANVFHHQSFVIPNYGEYGSAAWMNFNNIAIDGSMGDLDCGSKINPESGYVWWQRQEAFGSALMYLMFVHRTHPELLSDKGFLNKYFKSWKKGIGNDYTQEMMECYRDRDTFTDVVGAIDTFSRWYSSPADTKPGGSRNTIGWLNYLQDKAKDIWIPSANAVIKTVRENREIVGI